MNSLAVALPDYATYDYNRFRGRYRVTASGSGIGSSSDSGSFVCHPFDVDGSISALVTSVESTTINAMAGVMVRESLAVGSPHMYTAINPTSGAVVQTRTSSNAVTSTSVANGAVNAPYWVRVVRSGNSFTQFISPDSVTWTNVGTQTISMNTVAEACLASTSAVINDTSVALYDGVSVVPAPWLPSDIGAPLPGSSMFDGTSYTLLAAGAGFGGTSDAGHLLCRPVTSGDWTLSVRVVSEEVVGGVYQAGVMFRASITATSVHTFMSISSSGNSYNYYRSTTAGGTSTTLTTGTPPYWVRIVKVGDTYTASRSTNGSTWSVVGTVTISMGSTPYACLAASSRTATRGGFAVFDNLNLTAP